MQTPDTGKSDAAHVQVKNFGRRGRTKHTHLVDQDTTKFDDDYAVAKPLQDKYFQKLGGTAQEFSRSACCVHPCTWCMHLRRCKL